MAPKRSLIGRLLSPPRAGRKLFTRDETGAVAVEFAILALPFFTLIFAILETAIVFLAGQILDAAVHDASRKIRTGQAQQASWDLAAFRTEVCDRLYGMFDCAGLKLKIEVVSSFADVDAAITSPIDENCMPDGDPEEDCDWVIVEEFTPGVGLPVPSTVLVQVYYKWPTLVNLPGFNLATQAGNSRLMSAVRVLRNEPF
jgi:Flp pilus assembly protein TadG